MNSITDKRIAAFADDYLKHDPWTYALFTYAYELLKQERVPMMTFFELIHEIGHVLYGREMNANIVFMKVANWLFYRDGEYFTFQKKSDDVSVTLLYMDSNENLRDRYLHAIEGGLLFSKKAKKIPSYSISAFIFNWVNSPSFRFYRKGSDRDLITAFLNVQGFDEAFHQQYKRAGEFFIRTHDYELTLEIK